MSPVLLLLLLLISESSGTPPEGSTGLSFVVVFPENIAYYHPTKPKNTVHVTALHDGTHVTLKQHVYHSTADTLAAGQTKEFAFDARMELTKTPIANQTLLITSTKEISVHAVSLRDSSIQTALVVPTDRLGREYLVPPVPAIQGTTEPADAVSTAVTEREPFKLIIANADQENVVAVGGGDPEEVSLQPHQIAQVWVRRDEEVRTVKAAQPVAVIFGHTCAVRANCTCGLLYALLPPVHQEKLKFFVPPHLAKGATFVLLSETESTEVQAFSPDAPLVQTTGTAVLYRPGLLLALIPETDFAACSVVNAVPGATNFAVIVVHEDSTDGVRVGELPPQSAEWQELKGTKYVSTQVALPPGKTVIWHASSKMAVYLMGEKEGAPFGNPAAIISKTPDFRGCVLSPEVVEIGEVAAGWRESVKYCRDKQLELVSFPEEKLQAQIYSKLVQANPGGLQQLWIGLRRSSQTGQWYWLSRAPLNHTGWAAGEPGSAHRGQCAALRLAGGRSSGWRDEDCCEAARPVCYRRPVFLPV